eukprot:5131613-Pyramimonas_sp.AAC.1
MDSGGQKPMGPDGVRLSCHEGDSEERLVRDCSRRRRRGNALFLDASAPAPPSAPASSPLALLEQRGPPGPTERRPVQRTRAV